MERNDHVRLARQAGRWAIGRYATTPYRHLRAFIHEVTGGNAAKAASFVSELALWSPRTTFAAALNYAVTAHNSYELGIPADRVHTTVQAN
jgi:hypothetical protein